MIKNDRGHVLADEKLLPYEVGALLYCPANHEKIASEIIMEKIPAPYSLALCLEDAISDNAVEAAEDCLAKTFQWLWEAKASGKHFYLPKLFIRVRQAEQIQRLYEKLHAGCALLTGFIFPKFSVSNCGDYIKEIRSLNRYTDKKIYMMPILESQDIVSLSSRYPVLEEIRSNLDAVKEYVLNVRVGGNDFCKNFGIRRHVDETIYEIGCISSILNDIVSCFSRDYIVSGPVWEYFGKPGGEWEEGLTRELKYDRLNGFIGKTAIHPSQVPVVNRSLMVSSEDYEDALKLYRLENNDRVLVEKSASGGRMNEYKTHIVWAEKTLILGKTYGVYETCSRQKIPLSI